MITRRKVWLVELYIESFLVWIWIEVHRLSCHLFSDYFFFTTSLSKHQAHELKFELPAPKVTSLTSLVPEKETCRVIQPIPNSNFASFLLY